MDRLEESSQLAKKLEKIYRNKNNKLQGKEVEDDDEEEKKQEDSQTRATTIRVT